MDTDTLSRTPEAPARDQPRGRAALLIIDMINCFDFEEAEQAIDQAVRAAEVIKRLSSKARAADCPVIYVNDHFGEWHSERSKLIERAADNPVTPLLAPQEDDYFIIKPQFSGFYATSLQVLLPKLGVDRLILTGIATEVCVLFTAADAHMRDYPLWVPSDAVASVNPDRGKAALAIMQATMRAEIGASHTFELAQWSHSPAVIDCNR